MAGATQNWPTPTNAEEYFRQGEKRIGMEERRPRVSKASDLLGPLFGPSAITLDDSLNSNLMVFNGLFVVPPGTPESPDPAKWWMGQSIAQDGIGGVQVLYTFQVADAPHRVVMRGWETVIGTGGLRTYTPWQDINEEDPAELYQVVLPATISPTSTANLTLTGLSQGVVSPGISAQYLVTICAEVQITVANTLNTIGLLVDGVEEAMTLRTRGDSTQELVSGSKVWLIDGLAAGAHTFTARTRNGAAATGANVAGLQTTLTVQRVT